MKKIGKILGIMCAAMLMLIPGRTANAADSDLSIYSRTTTSVTVQWNSLAEASGYYVGIGETKDKASEDADTKKTFIGNTSHTFSNLVSGRNYYVNVKYFINNNISTLYDYGSIAIVTTVTAPTGLKQTGWLRAEGKAAVTWNESTGAEGYEVKITGDDETRTKTVTENKYSFSIDLSESYKIQVRAYSQINGSKQYSDYSEELTLFSQPVIRETETGYAVSVEKKKLKIKWYEQETADGYEIYVSTKKNTGYKKVKTIKNGTKTSATVTKFGGKRFNPKKKYYVYVVSYIYSNGKKIYSPSNYVVYYNNKNTYLTIKKN